MDNKILHVVFYKSDSGTQPVRDWIMNDLSIEEKKAVGHALKKVEFGWPVGMPTCAPMGNGLYEVRVPFKSTAVRIYFCLRGAQMVLLHYLVKKTQKTPKQDLDIARKRQKQLNQRG